MKYDSNTWHCELTHIGNLRILLFKKRSGGESVLTEGQHLPPPAEEEVVYIPIHKRAYNFLLKSGDKEIEIPMPSAITLAHLYYYKEAIAYENGIGNKPLNVIAAIQGGHYCTYCGSALDLQIDHIIPQSSGGTDELRNLVLACGMCRA